MCHKSPEYDKLVSEYLFDYDDNQKPPIQVLSASGVIYISQEQVTELYILLLHILHQESTNPLNRFRKAPFS